MGPIIHTNYLNMSTRICEWKYCECGEKYTINNKKRHLSSQKHKELLNKEANRLYTDMFIDDAPRTLSQILQIHELRALGHI